MEDSRACLCDACETYCAEGGQPRDHRDEEGHTKDDDAEILEDLIPCTRGRNLGREQRNEKKNPPKHLAKPTNPQPPVSFPIDQTQAPR